MRKDITVKINTENGRVIKSNSVLGISGENLQGNLIFELDKFILGQAYVEIEFDGKKNLIPLELQDDKYILPIKNSLLTCDMLKMDLLIQETSDLEQAPVFKSEIMNFRVANSINALESLKDDYPNILDVINNKQNKLVAGANVELIENEDGTVTINSSGIGADYKAGTNIEITKDGTINNTYVLPNNVVKDDNYIHTDNNYSDEDKKKLEYLGECNIIKLTGTSENPIDLNTIVDDGIYYITGEKLNSPIIDDEFELNVIRKNAFSNVFYKYQFIHTIDNMQYYSIYFRAGYDDGNLSSINSEWSKILDSSQQLDPNNYLSKNNTAPWVPTALYHPATKDYVDRTISSKCLSKTNTTEYTPTSEYHPATKGYVDSAVSSVPIVTINILNDWDTLDNFKTNMLPIIQKIISANVSYPYLFLTNGQPYAGYFGPVMIDKSYAGGGAYTIKLSVMRGTSIITYTILYSNGEIRNTEVPTPQTIVLATE